VETLLTSPTKTTAQSVTALTSSDQSRRFF
jgi:hypothetical protein